MVNTYPQHSSLGWSRVALWVQDIVYFCVEMGTRRDFILLSPLGWGNCYLPAAISTNLPSSLETSNLAFSLFKVKKCFFTVPRLSPPYFSVTKYTHSNRNDSWQFNTQSNTAPSSTTGSFLHFWRPFFYLITCFLPFSERAPLDKNNAGHVRHHCEYQWRFFSFPSAPSSSSGLKVNRVSCSWHRSWWGRHISLSACRGLLV